MRKLAVSVCLLLGGAAVFVLGSPYYSVFPTNRNRPYLILLTAFFLAASKLLKRSPSLSAYGPPAYALFVAAGASLFLTTGILNIYDHPADPFEDLALDKLFQFLHVVPVILVLTLVRRRSLRSILIARGNLRAGLVFGTVSFLVFAIVAYVVLLATPGAPSPSARALLFVLLWAFANSIMEELWFRAIFLKAYQRVIGRTAAILITSVVFGASHVHATYDFPGGAIVFGVVVFALGAAGAYLMSKTESLIGAVLLHAGYDLTIILPVLASA